MDDEFFYFQEEMFRKGDMVRLLKDIRVQTASSREKNKKYLTLPSGSIGEVVAVDKTGPPVMGHNFDVIFFEYVTIRGLKEWLLDLA